MLKRTFITILTVIAASTVMAQAYRWTDSDGLVHYSDKPEEGAEQIELLEGNSGTRPIARRIAVSSDAGREPVVQQQSFSYDTIEISAPAPEETLWNIAGVVNVSLNVQPGLQPGHRVRVYFDGESTIVSGTSIQLQDVYRGTHNIQVEVLDETDKLMGRSQPNRFYVRQNSIIN